MFQYLKIKLGTLVFESRLIRSKERHTLANARALSGRYSKKHELGSAKPSMPEKTERAFGIEDAVEKSRQAYELFWGLQHHRKNRVRKAARNTNVALAFLRGYDYEKVEKDAKTEPDWKDIERMVCSYGEDNPQAIKQKFEMWMQNRSTNELVRE